MSAEDKEIWKQRANELNADVNNNRSKKVKRKKEDFVRLGKNKRNRPSQAPSSYAVFCKENTQKILAANAKVKFLEISKRNSETWRALSDAEKDVYKQKAESIKEMLFTGKAESQGKNDKISTKANDSFASNVDNKCSPTSTSTVISDKNRECITTCAVKNDENRIDNDNDTSTRYDNSISVNTNSAINDNNTTINTTMTDSIGYMNNDNEYSMTGFRSDIDCNDDSDNNFG